MVRYKNRYFLVQINLQEDGRLDMSQKKLAEYLRKAIRHHHGDFGSGSTGASLAVKYLNPVTSIATIRCSKDFESILSTTLPLIRMLGKQHCQLETIRKAGTLRTCQQALVKYNQSFS
eukprot:TRINITY_DN5527_c0_g1_i2.p1 TRINITY_DN5527_c0_g1~~TRINITY_DN5527_c0_g1_i2.p1  ORF type:complete len:118 (+),score=3.77 TRINITY_DN5527_c0_g1_i2:121-474(+)